MTDTATEKYSLGPVAKLWLLVSVLINVSGIASIMDGFFRWHGFFRDFLDLYRAWIRGPVSWALHLAWPASWPHIPETLIDLLIVWSGFFLATNIYFLKEEKKLLVAGLIEAEGIFKGILSTTRFFLFTPLFVIADLLKINWPAVGLPYSESDYRTTLEILLYFAFLIACVILLMFLNWQFQHYGRM